MNLLTGDIEPGEYRQIKNDYEARISTLEMKLTAAAAENPSIEPLLKKALFNLCNLDQLYKESDNKGKRDIVGSIFPEKLSFDNINFRTARLNEAAELIYSQEAGF